MRIAMPTARAHRTPAVVNMRWLGVKYNSTRHLKGRGAGGGGGERMKERREGKEGGEEFR